jgi:thiosulfate dehydrogenase [quinone] large subunit
MSEENRSGVSQVKSPPWALWLFESTGSAWIWLIVRLYLGWQWITPGLEKVRDPAWTGANAGAALTGFIRGAIAKATGAHPAVQGWYARFLDAVVLPNAPVFSRLVAYGELLVGIALILGLLTGIAAFFGTFMNFSYLMAGTVSTNPMLFALATFVVLAWKVAGWWGLDRWILPALGTPWEPKIGNRGGGRVKV